MFIILTPENSMQLMPILLNLLHVVVNRQIMAVQQTFVTLILCLLNLLNTATNTVNDKRDVRENFRSFHRFSTNRESFSY